MNNSKRTMIALGMVKPDPKNPRQDFEPKLLKELENSIKANGILNPLVVEEMGGGAYLLVDGERRYRAAKNLGLKEVPVTVMESMTDAERLVKRFHLQEQHSNWNHYEKSVAVAELQKFSTLTTDEIANMLGISSFTVAQYFLVSSLSKRTAAEAITRKLPFSWLVQIAATSKSVDGDYAEYRKDLERALFQKIEDRIVTSAREMAKYRVAVQTKGIEVIKKIINDPKYTPNKASYDSGTDNVVDLSNLSKEISAVLTFGRKILIKKVKVIPTRYHDRFVELKAVVDELCDIDHEEDNVMRGRKPTKQK